MRLSGYLKDVAVTFLNDGEATQGTNGLVCGMQGGGVSVVDQWTSMPQSGYIVVGCGKY